MNNLPFEIIEVFDAPSLSFKGNTAAVVWTEKPLTEEAMQIIATDLNQPATTFLSPSSRINGFQVRWFAPDEEIGLCGHGSLAAIAYLGNAQKVEGEMTLMSPKGIIKGRLESDHTASITLDAIPVIEEQEIPSIVQDGLGIPLAGYFTTNNKHIVLAESEQDIKEMKPDFSLLRKSETFGYTVTAPGELADFVSRTIVPHVQQLEDPATGSSHAALVPFWSERTGKQEMLAYQLSARGGKFQCIIENDMVTLTGAYQSLAYGQLSSFTDKN